MNTYFFTLELLGLHLLLTHRTELENYILHVMVKITECMNLFKKLVRM